MAGQQHILTHPAAGSPAVQARAGWLVVAAMILTGLTMRTTVTSVGAVLDDLRAGLHVGSGVAGVITTLPVVCFAAIGMAAPRIAHHVGEHLLLVASLLMMTLGLVLRAIAGNVWLFLMLSVLALCGGAISNVLMPTLVKRHFPTRIGVMTAAYTTALAVGLTAAAGLTVPLGHLASRDGWRLGLGSWAALSALAVLPWLPSLRGDRPDEATPRALFATRLIHSRISWALAVFFGAQAFQAYVAFGWFATYLRDHGASAGSAGLLVAFLAAVSIPVSIVAPMLAMRGQRPIIAWMTVSYLVAYVGMLVAPIGGAWLWMLLAGIGSGMFPVALTMIGLRTRSADTTSALSAFSQGVGYLFAGTGPLLVGILLGSTNSWSAPFTMLFVVLGIAFCAGWIAASERFVDDELDMPLQQA